VEESRKNEELPAASRAEGPDFVLLGANYRIRFVNIARNSGQSAPVSAIMEPAIKRQTGFGPAQHSMRPWPQS
jgi:hypothetical protein